MGPNALQKYVVMDVFMFLTPIALLAGSFGITERIGWLQEDRRVRIGVCVACSVAVAVVAFGFVFWSALGSLPGVCATCLLNAGAQLPE